MAKEMERSTLEAYGGVVIGVASIVIPLAWYVKLTSVLIVAGLALDIAFRAPWFIGWGRISKLILWIITAVIIGLVTFQPIKDQYIKDNEAIGAEEARKLASNLNDLSAAILSFCVDRVSRKPQRENGLSSLKQWTLETNYTEETGTKALQQFGSKEISYIIQLKSIGIIPPDFIESSISRNPEIIGKWLGAIGRLLEEGKLKQAQAVGPNQSLWWNYAN